MTTVGTEPISGCLRPGCTGDLVAGSCRVCGSEVDTSGTGQAGGQVELPVVANLDALLDGREKPPRPSAWSASVTFGWRAMLKIKHLPEQLFDVTAFPIIMVLMFTYLFGGALAGSVTDYLQFVLPGIMVTSVIMITMYTGAGVNSDSHKGVFDRFRTLPIWRPAPLLGALFGDVLRYFTAAMVVLGLGLALGFRPQGGAQGVVLGIALLVGFAFALSWLWTMVGLLMRSEKSVMGISINVLFPLTFLSNVFVEAETMPGWLQVVTEFNPVTHLVTATRGLMHGDPVGGEITWVIVAGVVCTAVFGTLTMRLYNRK